MKTKKKEYFVHGLLVFLVFISVIYGLFFFGLRANKQYLGQAVVPPAIPTDCSEQSIRELWESVFIVDSDDLNITTNTSQSGRCNAFAAYKEHREELHIIIGMDMGNFFMMDWTIVMAIHANITGSIDEFIEKASALNGTVAVDLLQGRNLEFDRSQAHYGSIFGVEQGNWSVNSTDEYVSYEFEEQAVSGNKTEMKIGIVVANYTMDAYYYIKLAVPKYPPQIEEFAVELEPGQSKDVNLSDYIDDQDNEFAELEIVFAGQDNVNISVQQDIATITPIPPDWAGTDHVTLTVRDPDGNQDSKTVRIYVDLNGAPAILKVSPQIASLIMMVTESRLFAHNSTDPESDNLTSYWLLDNSVLHTGNDYNYTAQAGHVGNRTLKLVVSDGSSNTSHEWEIIVVELDRPPEQIRVFPDLEWAVGTNLTDAFNLREYFAEPDSQDIIFGVEGNEHIDVVIDVANNVSLYPEPGWSGTETIRFIADDGNFMTKSQDITLRVGSGLNQGPGELCTEIWNCSRWAPEECPATRVQERSCEDINSCGTELRKPAESRTCSYMPEDTGIIEASADSAEIAQLSPELPMKDIKLASLIISIFVLGGLISLVVIEKNKSGLNLEKEKKKKDIETESLARLLDYIRREMNEGADKDKIRSKLLYEGWNQYLVDRAFSEVEVLKDEIEEGSGIEAIVKESVFDKVRKKMKSFET